VRLRFALAGLVALSASLAACSSGTSCGFGCPVTTPTAQPLSLSGTQTQDFTYYYGYPTTEPPSTITTAISQTVTVSATALASPFPAGTANDVRVAETDTIDGLQSIPFTTDAYEDTSGTNVVLYGSASDTPASGDAQSTLETLVYDTPRIVDQSPQTNGATWTNKPGATLNEVYGDGHSNNRVIADDGSYREVGYAQSPSGAGYIPVDLFEDASGAGEYSGPFFGQQNIDNVFDAPAGNPATITATFNVKGGAKGTIFTIPAWYASNPTLYSESNAIVTGATLPKGCASASPVNEVRQKFNRLDTIIGYTERGETDSYESNGTVVCVVYSDTLVNYYDWNGDTTARTIPYASPKGKKISQVITSELITQSGAGASASAHRARGARVAGIPAIALGALQERFNAKIAATKRKLLEKNGGVR